MATIRGTAINFGFPTTTDGITITNVVGVLQSAEITEDGDMEEVRDADGDLASEVHYNRNQKATLEIVITGTNLAGANHRLRWPAGTYLEHLAHHGFQGCQGEHQRGPVNGEPEERRRNHHHGELNPWEPPTLERPFQSRIGF
jgi:hypothetical protein